MYCTVPHMRVCQTIHTTLRGMTLIVQKHLDVICARYERLPYGYGVEISETGEFFYNVVATTVCSGGYLYNQLVLQILGICG